jgi:hypothetical protein
VAPECWHCCAIAAVARPVGRGSSRSVRTPLPGSMSPLPVRAWRTSAWASWFAPAWPVWTRMARARAVAVLNAAMRMAWVILVARQYQAHLPHRGHLLVVDRAVHGAVRDQPLVPAPGLVDECEVW